MGFKAAVEKILRYVPPQRQTLLFSATVSDEIKKIASKSLRPGHVYVDCVGENDTDSAGGGGGGVPARHPSLLFPPPPSRRPDSIHASRVYHDA